MEKNVRLEWTPETKSTSRIIKSRFSGNVICESYFPRRNDGTLPVPDFIRILPFPPKKKKERKKKKEKERKKNSAYKYKRESLAR